MMQFGGKPEITGEWECAECGYIEEGVSTRRPQACPECDAPDVAFDFYAYEDADDGIDLMSDVSDEDDKSDWDADDEDEF